MIRYLLLFMLLSQFFYAKDIIIENDFKKSLYKESKKVFITQKSLTIYEIQNKKFSFSEKTNFPKTPNYIWVKFKLINHSNKDKELYFRNIRAGIDYIDVYILKDKKVKKVFYLGDLRSQNSKGVLSKNSVFLYNFQSDSEYEIYIKYKSTGSITNKWEIFTYKSFFKVETVEAMVWGVIYGILISLMIYHTILFFNTRNSAFLLYVLSTLFLGLYLLSVNGVIYQLDIGINLYLITIFTWYFAYLYI
ncbi:hypothetical protein CRU96_12225, partial [Malaciobacter halophilus]